MILTAIFWEFVPRQSVVRDVVLAHFCSLFSSREAPECGGATFPWEVSNWASNPPVSLDLHLFSILIDEL
jgi:hypothetical protein